MNLGFTSVVAGSAAQTGQPAGTPPPPITAPFIAHTIATGIRGGCQVVAADLNHDGKIDLIGLGSVADSLVCMRTLHGRPMSSYRPGEWKREFIPQENKGVVHGLLPFDWYGDGHVCARLRGRRCQRDGAKQ